MSVPTHAQCVSAVANVGSVLVPKPHYRSTRKSEGVCFGMTVLWIRGIIQKNVIDYGYSTFEAELMHNKYNIMGGGKVRGDKDFWEARKRTFEDLNLKMVEDRGRYFFGTCSDAFDWVQNHPLKVFSIKVPGHALAAYYKRPEVYYFDPNYGVYEYPTINDFCIYAYLHAFFDYCDWQAEPKKNEVFVLPVEAA